MKTKTKDYSVIFETIVEKMTTYLIKNNIKAQIIGISGGIDSAVCAAICHEVSKRTGIPLIGRSLPTKFNKEEETTTADLVGKAFCDDYKVFNMDLPYRKFAYDIAFSEGLIDTSGPFDFDKKFLTQTKLANGNIQARLRMIYLYNLAGIYKGLVIDTDNLTEHNIGYFTTHGDVGDIKPIGKLWKTEVFELARWLLHKYQSEIIYLDTNIIPDMNYIWDKGEAIKESLKLKPTAGLGITDSDLEEIGAESYDQVDAILQEILKLKELNYTKFHIKERLKELDIDSQIIENVFNRHFNSEFKRLIPIEL